MSCTTSATGGPSFSPAVGSSADRLASPGENVSVTLTVEGNPRPKVKVYGPGQHRLAEERNNGKLLVTLFCTNLKESHFGRHYVTAINDCGESNFSINILKRGRNSFS